MKNKIYITLILLFIFIYNPVLSVYAQDIGSTDSDILSNMAILVFQLSIILFAAWGGGTWFRKMGLPPVLGEILAGVIIGPYLLGGIPLVGFEQGMFPLHKDFPISSDLYSFTTVASIILLFLVGLETDIETFLSFSVAGTMVAIGGVVCSFILGALIGVLASPYLFGVQYSLTHPVSLFFGVISTATSVGISARILSEKRKLDSPEGVTILSGAVIDDVLGIIVLAIILGVLRSGYVEWRNVILISLRAIAIWLGFTILGLTFSQKLSHLLKRLKDKTTISIISFAFALLLAGIFEKSGLAMIIGAYIMGLSLSKTDIAFIIQEKMSILQKFFVPIFFCVMGMLVNLKGMGSSAIIIFGIIYTIFAILGKIVGCGIPALFLNFNLRGALRVGIGMIPRGEVALIIAGIGLSTGLIKHDAFNMAIMMTFITTLITPPFLSNLLESEKPVLRKEPPLRKEKRQITYKMPNPETAEFIIDKLIDTFENEGFFVYHMALPEKVYQIRKEETFITLKYISKEIIFDCSSQDTSFVHTVFYEVIAEIDRIMESLQKLTDREAIGKKIFDTENGTDKEKKRFFTIPNVFAVEVTLKGKTKPEIIEELVNILIKSEQLDDSKRKQALKDLVERENNMSTGMQDGIAMPHARTDVVDHIVCAVGLKKEGINFDSLDKKPSNIFVITLAPEVSSEPYLQFMSEISGFLMDEKNRDNILSCRSKIELFRVFTSNE